VILPVFVPPPPDLAESAAISMPVERRYSGAAGAELDILRPYPGASRIFVQARLPNGDLGVFLVDTGADVSVLSDRATEALGITADREVAVWGLSGSASVKAVLLPELAFGDVVVPDVDVLVGVPGFQDQSGFMPVDGLLGNNVWGRFTLEIDYPADVLVLHPPDWRAPEGRSAPMFFDGSHVHTPLTARTSRGEGAPRQNVRIIAQVDTGASDLTVCAATGAPFSGSYTEGLETVRGIGASETLPPFRFLEMTRRIPLAAVQIGGAWVRYRNPARWMDYEETRATACGGGDMRALIGHEYMAGHRVIFDYAGGRLALLDSKRKPRQLDATALLLGQERERHGDDPTRGLVRAKLLLGSLKEQEALAELQSYVHGQAGAEDHAEAQVLLAQVLRSIGRHEDAWKELEDLSAGALVDEEQIIGTVNGLMFEARADEALGIAQTAVRERPDDGWAHVALADVLFASGELDPARDELIRAAEIEAYPDAHHLRRARVALASGDRVGAMARMRRMLVLYPNGGPYLWFYAMLVETDLERETFREDVERAMARLHPYTRPFDFLVAAHRVLGDDKAAQAALAEGLAAHCKPMPKGADQDNCYAWYYAMAGERGDDALERIERALAKTGERPDFLDTKAMVHLSRAEYPQALEAANAAARLSPDDVYMLWQAERIAQIAREALSR
jgi:tetratricopeptide (TPR) repeat protein